MSTHSSPTREASKWNVKRVPSSGRVRIRLVTRLFLGTEKLFSHSSANWNLETPYFLHIEWSWLVDNCRNVTRINQDALLVNDMTRSHF
jgi:hypothetical protein